MIRQKHIIETDFEPDDAVAILAHASQYTDIDLVVIVGESKPHYKIPIVTTFFEKIIKKYPSAYSTIEIIQGFGSDKKYPIDDQAVAEAILEDSEKTIIDNYIKVYSNNPNISFMMKSPREAMKTKIYCPNTIVYCYGSFNWRTLKLPIKEYQDLMSRYKKFYYFDSFTAIGEKNSGIFNKESSEVNDMITGLIIRWNKYLISECEKDISLLNPINDEVKYNRKKKIIENINKGINNQFVLADVCLFLCPLPTEQVKLEEINPYNKYELDQKSNLYVFDSNTELRYNKLLHQQQNASKLNQHSL